LIAFIMPMCAMIVGRPRSAVRISISIAVCHSGAADSLFGRLVM
jgi:hypothetical protein